jgi:hypothetical protein
MMFDCEAEGWTKGLARPTIEYEHYNGLFAGGMVQKIAENSQEVYRVLWGPKAIPYDGWPGY